MIGIIDYGLGNLASVKNALDNIAAESKIIVNPEEACEYSKLILPGVGAFHQGMDNLNKYEKEKLLNLLEYSESDLNVLFEKLNEIITENDNVFDVLLKILQQGLNIREATLLGLYYGQKNGYKKAKLELENEIKDKLFRAFKNNQ